MQVAVNRVSFDLSPGEITSLVGASGSGKSTIALIIAQLIRQTSGTVSIDGAPVHVRGNRDRIRYSKSVQMVLQDPYASLNPSHTVRYILGRSLRIHGAAPTRGDIDGEISALLTRVNLADGERYLDRYPHQLSGGERQRVAIARSLAAKPRVLIADEPVSMLDVSIRLDVLRLLRDLTDAYGIAMLYITHDLATVSEFSRHALVLHNGVVVEHGRTADIVRSPSDPYTARLLDSIPRIDGSRRTAATSEG